MGSPSGLLSIRFKMVFGITEYYDLYAERFCGKLGTEKARSGAGGAVVPHPQPPQGGAGNEKQQGQQGQRPYHPGPRSRRYWRGQCCTRARGTRKVSTSSTGLP